MLVASFVLPEGYGIIRPHEPFCIDYDKKYPEGVGMDDPADRPYRWYIYRLIRKGYNDPVKVEFIWSRDFDIIKGKVNLPDMGKKAYNYPLPKKVYRSTVTLKRTRPERFNLEIEERPEGLFVKNPFPVQEINFMSSGFKPVDGSEGRDCKRRFLLDRVYRESYGMKKEDVLKNISVVLSPVEGYKFRVR